MPKLPDASNLSGVNIGAPRSMVNMPVPDIAGATSSIARGISDLGQGVSVFAEERRKKAAAQERFDTKMGLLKAEEAYAEATRDLDPLDPEYVEKKRARRREIFAPILSNVRDPENRQFFDLSTEEDYVRIGMAAGEEQKKARGLKNGLDIKTYAEEMRKRVAAGEDPEKVRTSVMQMIQDAPDLDQLQKTELEMELLPAIDADAAETKGLGLISAGAGTAQDKAAAVLRKFEGFRATPYWDVNADRVGYGSDTVTLADGSVVKVTKGMRITKADAERDLKRRTAEFMSEAAAASGPAWDNLSPDQQAALTSVAYNYGSLPKRVITAIQTGDANSIANAVESLSDHNGGVNRKRREAEAALIRGSAAIPSSWSERPKLEMVLAELEQDPSYLRLGVDQRDKIRNSVITRYEKVTKEEEAAAKIELQRDTVDYAVSQFDDPAKGEAYIKSTITDPDTREDALTMFRKEQDQIAENARRQNEANVNAAWEGVTTTLDAGGPDAVANAQKIARTADIPAKDREALLERIDKGRAVVDDPEVYNEIQALKLGSAEDRENFSNLDLVKFQGKLKPGTIEALAKDQEALRKQLANTGKAVSLETPAAMLDQRLREIGIDVSSKAPEADLRTARTIRSIMARNLEAATRARGTDLSPTEIEKVMDQTFMEFRVPDPGIFWDGEKTMNMADVIGEFTTIEDSYGAVPGEYLTRAERAIRAKGLDVTPQLLSNWLRAAVNQGVIRKAQ